MADQSIIVRHKAAVPTTGTTIDFGTAVQRIYITAITQDVLIEPNGSANSDSFRIVAGQNPASFDFTGSQVRTLGLQSVSATSDVTVMGVVT